MHRRKRIDPRVIGSFVVGAVILSVAGLLFFGPGGLLSETRTYVIYFESSVKGLNVGSPVRFRGVKIGQVRDINVRIRPSDFEFSIPVVIEIEPARIKAEGTKQGLLEALKTSVQGEDPVLSLVDKGLRAQLQLDSLVTGQLYVNVDMFPNTPVVLSDNISDYPELPSISSSLEELTKTFEDLPLKELARKLIRSAEGFEKIITSPSLHNALEKMDGTADHFDKLLRGINQELPELLSSFRGTLAQTQQILTRIDEQITPLGGQMGQLLAETRSTLEHIDAKVDPLTRQLDSTLETFAAAATNADAAMEQLRTLSGADSQLVDQLSVTLRQVNEAARTVRILTDELERDPQMLLRGRADGEE